MLRTQTGQSRCARTIERHLRPPSAVSSSALSSLPKGSGRTVLASDRISRTVKYASSCPRLCAATSNALWYALPRCGSATLGLRKILQLSLLFRNLSPEYLIKAVRRRLFLMIPCSIDSFVDRCSILLSLDLY